MAQEKVKTKERKAARGQRQIKRQNTDKARVSSLMSFFSLKIL